jgi:hypothetical protein
METDYAIDVSKRHDIKKEHPCSIKQPGWFLASI